jgi:hypothetical protein
VPKPRRRQSKPRTRVTERSLLSTAVARQAFDKLTKDGVDKHILLALLCEIPSASEKRQPLVAGMSDRRLRALSDRVRSWADAIEGVNRSSLVTPEVLRKFAGDAGTCNLPRSLGLLCSSPEAAKDNAENFWRLPHVLRVYAGFLQDWTAFLTRPQDAGTWGRSLSRWSLRGFRPRTILVLRLMKLVRDTVGRPCRREIATLLTEAYRVAGILTSDEAVMEDDLKELEKNNPWPFLLVHRELWS